MALAGEVYRRRVAALEDDVTITPDSMEAERREVVEDVLGWRFDPDDGFGEIPFEDAFLLTGLAGRAGRSCDALADVDLLRPVLAWLGERVTLALAERADHSFHVPVSTGRRDTEVIGAAGRDSRLDGSRSWAPITCLPEVTPCRL